MATESIPTNDNWNPSKAVPFPPNRIFFEREIARRNYSLGLNSDQLHRMGYCAPGEQPPGETLNGREGRRSSDFEPKALVWANEWERYWTQPGRSPKFPSVDKKPWRLSDFEPKALAQQSDTQHSCLACGCQALTIQGYCRECWFGLSRVERASMFQEWLESSRSFSQQSCRYCGANYAPWDIENECGRHGRAPVGDAQFYFVWRGCVLDAITDNLDGKVTDRAARESSRVYSEEVAQAAPEPNQYQVKAFELIDLVPKRRRRRNPRYDYLSVKCDRKIRNVRQACACGDVYRRALLEFDLQGFDASEYRRKAKQLYRRVGPDRQSTTPKAIAWLFRENRGPVLPKKGASRGDGRTPGDVHVPEPAISHGLCSEAALPPDVAAEIRRIPEKLAAILSPYYAGNVQEQVWFRAVAENATDNLLSRYSDLRTPEDVNSALQAYAAVVGYNVHVSRAVLPLREKARGQQWVIDGVYDRSVLGPRQMHLDGVLLKGLSGECRHRILNDFRMGHEILEDVVFHGVRDPLNPQDHYWPRRSIGDLPSLCVSQLAQVVFWLSGLDIPVDLTVQRGITDKWRDLDFLLRAVKQSPGNEEEAKVKRGIALNWLWRNEDLWRNFAEVQDKEAQGKGDSLYGVVGKSIKNDFVDELWQKEIPITDTTLEFLQQRSEHRPSSKKKRDLSDCDGDSDAGFMSTWRSVSAFSPITSRRFEQIERATRPLGEISEIETGLLPEKARTPTKEAKRAVVPWLEAAPFHSNFVERVQVKLDVESAFHEVYGPGPMHQENSPKKSDLGPILLRARGGLGKIYQVSVPRKRLSGIALRDFRVFMVREISGAPWPEVGFLLPDLKLGAAKKNLERKRPAICEWLQRFYPPRRRLNPLCVLNQGMREWKADYAHQRTMATSEDGATRSGEEILESAIRHCREYMYGAAPRLWKASACRPEFLAGCRLPAVDISHDWKGTGNSVDLSYQGGICGRWSVYCATLERYFESSVPIPRQRLETYGPPGKVAVSF